MKASNFLLQRLVDWGVKRIYGYPGDGINGMLGALEDFTDKIQFIQARHEEMAAFMACAHAKFTGELGVCMATSGPGAIHLLNGLYDAKGDHAPVLAIVGQAATTAMGGSYQQEVDLQTLFKDVSDYNATIMNPSSTRHIVDRACRVAMGMRGVATVIFPKDLQEEDFSEPARKHNTIHSGVGYSAPMIIPRLHDLQRAAEILNGQTKIAMIVGAGSKNAADEIVAVADKLQACCAKALLGKDVLPDDLPWVTGTIGLLGTRPSSDIMNECDALLMVGTNFPYAEFLPKDGSVPAVQIDIDPRFIGLRYPTNVNLIGDAADTLSALLPHLNQKDDGSWRQSIKKNKDEWYEVERERAHQSADPLNPQSAVRRAERSSSRQRNPHRRCRNADELAGPAHHGAPRHEDLAVGHAGHDGFGGPLCDRREVRLSGSRGDRVARRRRVPNERDERDAHGQEVLEDLERSADHFLGAQQSGSEPGDLGDAHPFG